MLTSHRDLVGRVVCVTGGAGFIGSHLVDRLISEGAAHVVVIDNFWLGRSENLDSAILSKKVTVYREDIELKSALEYIFEEQSIDIVFNCATKALNYSFVNPSNAYLTNVIGVVNLLELQRKKKFRSLCHFSTSEVYGTAQYEPIDEKHPISPTTTYAAGKAAADLALESYVKMFGLDAFIVRPFNNFGPRQNYLGNLAAIIPSTVRRILSNKPPQLNGSGKQCRDFIYVSDTVESVIQLFPLLSSGDVVNVSSRNKIAMDVLVAKICNHMNYSGEVIYGPERQSDVLCHDGCVKKLTSMIDMVPTNFDVALRNTVDWYVERINRDDSINNFSA
jgi:UDP-glucose 4-epimerase